LSSLNPKRRILFVGHSSEVRGAEKSLHLLCKNLDRDRFEAVVVLPGSGPMLQMMRDDGIKVYSCDLYWWVPPDSADMEYFLFSILNMRKAVSYLLEIIRAENIDIVYTNTIVVAEGAVAAAIARLPHIWHIREMLRFEGSALRSPLGVDNVYSVVNDLSERVIAVSHSVAQDFGSSVSPSKLRIVYNGAPVPGGLPAADLDGTSGSAKVGFVGTLCERKGADLFVEAGIETLRRGFRADFYLVGSSPNKAFIDELRRKIGCEWSSYFHFLGHRDDVLQIFKSLDIFVLSSRNDPSPRTVVEAIRMGCPTIATRSGGAVNMLNMTKAGKIVDPTASAIAEALGDWITDKQGRLRCTESFKAASERLFTEQAYAGNVGRVLDEVQRPRVLPRARQALVAYFVSPRPAARFSLSNRLRKWLWNKVK
jgi:glycosyltransferase involved in cell wall biosynthesis